MTERVDTETKTVIVGMVRWLFSKALGVVVFWPDKRRKRKLSADEKKLQELSELIADEDRPGWQVELEGERRRLMGRMGLLECTLCGDQVITYEDERSGPDMNCDQCQDILDMTYFWQRLHFAKDAAELQEAVDEVKKWLEMQTELRQVATKR